MFVLNEVDQLGGIRLAHEFERLHLQGRRQLADDIHGLLGAQRLLQQILCIADAALRDVLLGQAQLVELGDDRFLHLRRHASDIGNLQRHLLDLFFF